MIHLRQLRRCSSALLRDNGLLQVLRSEIDHELSSSLSYNGSVAGSLVEGFMLDWDNPQTQDVVLCRQPDRILHEEIAISALLAPLRFRDDEDPLPRDAMMKVCIRRAGCDPVLRFDCRIFQHDTSQRSLWPRGEANNDDTSTDYTIKRVYHHSSLDNSSKQNPAGTLLSSLDPQLQKALKEYLLARGITPRLTNFLLEHLQRKEHSQYVTWLRTVESFVAKKAKGVYSSQRR